MFWADVIVQEIITKNKPPFHVYDWWTPSGMAHAGHIRTFLLHQAIYRGLKLAGYEATYHYGFDDMDPMDGFPPDLPEEWKQYMGHPLYKIPSPYEGYASLGDYYASKYLEAMEVLDIHPEIPQTSQMYCSGEFNEAITIVLDNAEKIRAIYADFGAERSNDWHPFQVICEECGKIGTTVVNAWDGTNVSYRCEPSLVTWAEGCGHSGTISPYNGNGKMHYKVEWAAKWFVLQYDYEGGGKDHYTKGSSRDYARRIVKDIFNADEPVGYPHEYFLIGGKKMASSKGLGLTANDASHILPPHIMRYFVYRIPINRQIEFNPEGDTIPRIFDSYDGGLQAVRNDPDSNEARALMYAHQDGHALPEYTMRFSKVSFLIQMPHITIEDMAVEEKGSPLTEAETRELMIRTEYARRWIESYATEELRFTLQPELPQSELTEMQFRYLQHIRAEIAQVEWIGPSVHAVLHEAKQTMGIDPKEAFGAIYAIFLGKHYGPQAGWFLAALDRSFVLHRIDQALNQGGYTHA